MEIDTMDHDGTLVIVVRADRIDAASSVQLKNQFREATEDALGRVVMNLEQVKFMDSSGLGAMVAALKLLKGRPLELANLTPTVAKVFALTRMDRVFTVHNDMMAALGPDQSDQAMAAI